MMPKQRKEKSVKSGFAGNWSVTKGEASESGTDYRSRVAGSFQSARKRSKKDKGELNTVLLRSGLLLFLTLLAIAFLTWGKVVLYSLLLVIPLYFYLKFRKG